MKFDLLDSGCSLSPHPVYLDVLKMYHSQQPVNTTDIYLHLSLSFLSIFYFQSSIFSYAEI